MPELPEVETVVRGLQSLLGTEARIVRMECRRADIRDPIPPTLAERLAGQPIIAIRRRAKYILFETPAVTLLCHLGMTGTWRLAPVGDERPHDHVYLHLADGKRLAYRDPRRFGVIDAMDPGGEAQHPRLRDLGPEPLDEDFDVGYLKGKTRGKKAAIKALIMDQAVVVGVGNIYAAEACFLAKVRPTRAAGAVTKAQLDSLVEAIRLVLRKAIAAGGSTISDFRQAGGDSGYFQHEFRVYGRSGQPCFTCTQLLKGGVIAGRSTVWCGQCQR